MIQPIYNNGCKLAVVVKAEPIPYDGVKFFSAIEDMLQVGAMRWPAGKVLQPHTHNPPGRLTSPAEVLFVRTGRVRVDLYYEGRKLPDAIELSGGDCIVLLAGGHGFEFLEDSVVWEVKTGPYLSEQDKHWIGRRPPSSPG